MREILREELARNGVMPFARFMELALYCPNFGYYEQLTGSPGRTGDFYTSVSVGPLFGELLAAYFINSISVECGVQGAELNVRAEWQILEAGAHDGKLAGDILSWMKIHQPQRASSLQYWILEPSLKRQESQRKTLAVFADQVRWFTSWNDLPASGVRGFILSNELLDAMPVIRIGWDASKSEWFEWGVKLEGENFVWARMSLTSANVTVNPFLQNSALPTPHSALLSVLPDGFTTEICPAAEHWWRQAAQVLKEGKLIAFDYGLTAEQFFTPERRDGTVRAYHQHRQNNELLARPGEQDLTAQVNFTAIREVGEAEGLKTETLTSQGQFLVNIVEKNCCDKPAVPEWTSSRVRQFQTLTHPEHLGRAFQVLVQTR